MMPERTRLSIWVLILLGLMMGYFSGLFGVGGGVVLVPTLMLLGIDQRIAAGTSTAAILPTAIVGTISYGVTGHVDWLAAALIAVGMIGGTQLGTYLLARLPRGILFWGFLGFLAVVAVSLWLVVPQRDAEIGIDVWTGAALVAVGLLTGVLSGLMGVGGGIILVPILMFFFGASDLVAKGTSLAMMVPGSISGTIGNARRRNVDLRMAAVIGVTACVASPLGTWTAQAITPFVSNIAFSVLLAFAAWQLIQKHLKARRASA
ncbi:sulfite exporter TauE/SafE family protein [Agromyces sp. NPDC060279]|uniref:sulfite exporter TauE/SafE family protein n=1 Tax=Agromyces sp. NPDC060279 TaxID=3347092 RepID=UPI00365889DA